MSNAEPVTRSPTDYPIPNVRIHIDEDPRSKERGLRIRSPAEIAEEIARLPPVMDGPARDPAATLQAAPVTATVPDSGAELLEIAKRVQAARTRLTRLDSRIAELTDKFHELSRLPAAVDAARDERAGLLADAFISGKRANTTKVDEKCKAALGALEKHQDEITAVERALATLQAERENIGSALTKSEASYKKARESHVRTIDGVRYLTLQFHEATAQARKALAEIPTHFHERLLSPPVTADCDPFPGADALTERVLLQAKACLAAAAELADIPPPPMPKSLGFVWSNGLVYQDPEPAQSLDSAAAPFAGLVRVE